ncbi:MAG: outer membrane beta-barrel protein [Thermoanaerobaculales bacterium]|nr:outer membrane beta-barrel protein [Thermoanaerobaculales bacterium]
MEAKKIILILLGVGLIMVSAVPAQAQGSWSRTDLGSFRVRLGLFQPQANSSYWDEKFSIWTGDPADMQDLIWGVDGVWMISPNSGIQFGSAWYHGETTQVYRDWVDENGNEIGHRMQLDTWELTAAWVFRPKISAVIQPYFGFGGGLTGWRLVERGEFIDFGASEDGSIFGGTYGDDGTTFLAFAELGFEVCLGNTWSFFVEGRWKEAEASLGGGFSDLNQDLDLSGAELSAGLAFNY